MIYAICGVLELIVMYASLFLVERYVFLERGLEPKKQRCFYAVTFGICMIIYFLFDNSGMYTDKVVLFFAGLNIALTRKEKKFIGFLMCLPMTGIVNGLIIPLVTIPVLLVEFSTLGMIVYSLILYGGIVGSMVVFYFWGKNWRKKFEAEMFQRHLQRWERILLCVVGVLMMIFSMTFTFPGSDGARMDGPIYTHLIMSMCLMGILSFVLVITVIVLIVQGNSRSYYHEQAMNIQKIEMEKEKAEVANEAKSVFLSNMSHEIRTPMNAIVGMTDILLREEHSPQTREYLNNIKNSGAALITIINDILDFSKIESGKMEIVEETYEPMSMFHDLSMIFLNRIGEKRIELIYEIDPKMPRKLRGDVQRVRQIIINLMNNAIKFTEEGHVKLIVKVMEWGNEDVELLFHVEDTGQGIKEEDIEKLFGSFQQVDTKKNHNKEGTGLGLAISKRLVELMHGKIGVKSKYGEGSSFYFTIPQQVIDYREAARLKNEEAKSSIVGIRVQSQTLREQLIQLASAYQVEYVDFDSMPVRKVNFLLTDDDETLTGEMKQSVAEGELCLLQNPMLQNFSYKSATIVNKPIYSLNFCQLLNHEELVFKSEVEENLHFVAPEAKILVVDDNEMNLKVAKGLLEPFQMQISFASNGKEALWKVKQEHYHMVFMDHMMPVMDGIEATRAIRALEGEEYQNLPIIALSANATSEARELFLTEKMNDFVAKPIKLKEMVQSLLRWLPEELITMEEPKSEAEGDMDSKEKEQFSIEGLDVAEGIKNCGSESLFFELLGDFYKLIEPKATKIEKCLADDLIRDYTIEVHALKNTARMIGAMELSELFYQMEQLGNAKETEEIKKRTPQVLELYRSYKPILEIYGKAANENRIQVPMEEIKATLQKLHDSMDVFDLDGADAAMKELETYALPEEIFSLVEQLGAYVADVAMEEVMELSHTICEKLEECQTEECQTDNGQTEELAGREEATILLVDDDEISSKAVCAMLKEKYKVIWTGSGRDAFDILAANTIDLVLLDIHMPGLDGHDVITKAKENPRYVDIPVVFLTSDEDEQAEVQGFKEGAIDFIRKPFHKEVALQRIERILELSHLQKYLQKEVEKQTNVAEKRREKVERISLQMVQALANTIDAKDSYTNGHSTRVAKYSVMIAKRMGYQGEELEQLQYAAMLHDIGKIGVPREIINKPDKLTEEEYQVIKTHPSIGGNILKEISEIPDIAIGARWHHERYDGKGYPDQISLEEIPEIARIIGVADAYDAMTSKRSYRDVLPQSVVRGELEKGKGTQFEPKIADIMLEIMDEDVNYEFHE